MVVVLQAAMMLLGQEISEVMVDMQSQNAVFPLGPLLALTLGVLVVSSIWLMLYLGFLKTAATENQTAHLPAQLLRCGRPYFWRYVFFLIQINLLMFLLIGILVGLIAQIFSKGSNPNDIHVWFQGACGLGVLLGMIKPMLFIPARIIVYGNTIFEALFAMSFYRMGQVRNLIRSIIIGFALLFAAAAYTLIPEGTLWYYIFSGICRLLESTVLLFLTLLVVLELQEQYNAEFAKADEEERFA